MGKTKVLTAATTGSTYHSHFKLFCASGAHMQLEKHNTKKNKWWWDMNIEDIQCGTDAAQNNNNQWKISVSLVHEAALILWCNYATNWGVQSHIQNVLVESFVWPRGAPLSCDASHRWARRLNLRAQKGRYEIVVSEWKEDNHEVLTWRAENLVYQRTISSSYNH